MPLKGKPVLISATHGNTATTIYTCPASNNSAVHTIYFSNISGSAITLTLQVFNYADNATRTIIDTKSIDADGEYTFPKVLTLGAGDKILATASVSTGLESYYSVSEDQASVASGFTPRGVWASGSSYVKNDVVSTSNGNSYVASQASSNQNPTTATTYWTLLSSKGDQGDVSLSGSQTLTNKVLTSPVLTTPTINDAFVEEVHTANSGSSITLDLANGSIQRITLTASTTITMPTATAGKSFLLYAIQDGTGSRTITWSTVKWASATAPTLTTTANYWDIFQFVADGSNWNGWIVSQNYT